MKNTPITIGFESESRIDTNDTIPPKLELPTKRDEKPYYFFCCSKPPLHLEGRTMHPGEDISSASEAALAGLQMGVQQLVSSGVKNPSLSVSNDIRVSMDGSLEFVGTQVNVAPVGDERDALLLESNRNQVMNYMSFGAPEFIREFAQSKRIRTKMRMVMSFAPSVNWEYFPFYMLFKWKVRKGLYVLENRMADASLDKEHHLEMGKWTTDAFRNALQAVCCNRSDRSESVLQSSSWQRQMTSVLRRV